MQKVTISVTNESIYFSYVTKKDATTINLDNTNIISDSELTFSTKYIEENHKIVSMFIKELCQEKNVYRATIETNDLALILCNLFKKNPYITAICIRENTTLPYSIYEKIIENDNINYVEAHHIQQFMIELFDKKGIRAESRTEIFYSSHFMQSNNLTNYSKIFYKMNIRLDQTFTEEDKDDFLAFCNVNKYLKTIHIDVYNKDDLENILSILQNNRLKNIKILIYDNIKNYKTIEYLKKWNKKLRKKKIKIELVYSKEYLKENLFTQIVLNTLKICGIILTIMVLSIIGYISISNYVSLQEVTQIQEEVKEIINENKDKVIDTLPTEKPIKNQYIASLLTANKDVVGWLKVNETNIDYPVVQSSTNDYYLKRNFYEEEDKNGWIFMDYRNDRESHDSNTIIFGHNMYYSGVMFGTLANVTKKSWYTNPDNQIISYDTVYESNQYQIFSIYIVPKTTDYLKIYFADNKEFTDFVDLIKGRSIYDFGIDVNPGDKIITLSTCSNHSNRLVVHAKLIKSETVEPIEEETNIETDEIINENMDIQNPEEN